MTTRRWAVTNTGNTAARVVTLIGALFAVIEVIYILLHLLGANAANGFFKFIQSLAEPLALFWPGLFPISDPNWAIIVNYGLAAIFWLVLAGLIAKLISR